MVTVMGGPTGAPTQRRIDDHVTAGEITDLQLAQWYRGVDETGELSWP
jgi:hypothetical protein